MQLHVSFSNFRSLSAFPALPEFLSLMTVDHSAHKNHERTLDADSQQGKFQYGLLWSQVSPGRYPLLLSHNLDRSNEVHLFSVIYSKALLDDEEGTSTPYLVYSFSYSWTFMNGNTQYIEFRGISIQASDMIHVGAYRRVDVRRLFK